MGQTFLTLQQELADRLGLDQTVAANQTRLQRWFNLIQQDIASRADWHWLESREVIQTTVQKTAGTVTATNGSTTVTGVGTSFAAADVGKYIQFQNTTNWYVVSAVGSGTSLTLEENYVDTSSSGLTYKIQQVYYDFSVSADRVLDVKQTNTPYKLMNLGYRTLDTYQPDLQTLGAPTGYYLFRLDPASAASASKQLQISFYPIADAQYNIECRTLIVPTDLSANTDVPIIPQKWLPVLLSGAEWLGAKYLNDPAENNLKAVYENDLARMVTEELSLNDYHPVLQPSDSLRRSLYIPFPSTFEQPL